MTDEHAHGPTEDPEMASRLRSARPRADLEFVAGLEGRLFAGERALRRRFSWRPAFVASLAVAGIALLTLALNLAGIGPFSDSTSVEAGNKCRTVTIVKLEKQPLTTPGIDGVVFMYKNVTRHVQRCD